MAAALHRNVRGFFAILWILLFQCAGNALAAPVPLKELEFMVRQKQPEAEIIVEVTRRKLLEKPSEAFIDKLILSGASPALIRRLRAPELVAPPQPLSATPPPPPPADTPVTPEPSPPTSSLPPPSPDLPNPKPRPGTVAAALDKKVLLERNNELIDWSLSKAREPRVYLLFFTEAEDEQTRKFIRALWYPLNQWAGVQDPRELEVCRASLRSTLMRHAIAQKAMWPLARYEELDPRIQSLCPEGETRIALITQDWEVLLNEKAPPADLAMAKVKKIMKERFNVQMR
jgi:hypothetical protein